jgi:tRNA(fMet)-specific endonuclease VapC
MYLLDTNVITHIQKGYPSVIKKINSISIDNLSICTIVLAECYFGALHHPTRSKEQIKYYNKYFEDFEIIDFDIKAALEYAKLRNELTQKGKLIADMDLMIASICIANDLILVTNNTKDFKRFDNLKLEDWTKV